MKQVVAILIFFFLTAGCTSKTIYPKPDDLIPKDTMGYLIRDLLVANSARNMKNKRLKKKINYHPLVYNKYKIDSARFHRSNFYYISKIDVYEEILQTVIKDFEEQRTNLVTTQKVNDSIRRDSIKKMKGRGVLKSKKLKTTN